MVSHESIYDANVQFCPLRPVDCGERGSDHRPRGEHETSHEAGRNTHVATTDSRRAATSAGLTGYGGHHPHVTCAGVLKGYARTI